MRKKPSTVLRDSSAALIASWLVSAWYVSTWEPVPEVFISYPDGVCKGVISEDPLHTCKNRPDIYTTIWVSPDMKRR